MTNYTQITSFGPKDALSTGDPAKKIVGSEFDAEFSAISTAISSKMNSADSVTNGQVPQSAVTQHQAALTILESQITDSTLLARVGSTETISAVWTFTALPAFNGGTSGASAPFTVDSTYVVTNLNADLLDGQEGSYYLACANFTGSLADARLSANVALYNASTANFTGTLQYGGLEVGFRHIPQNAQTGSYTCVLGDSGKEIYHAAAAGAATYTIPANASVAYPIGTCLVFTNMSTNAVTIAITSDTLYLAGAGTTGSRTLAQYGSATARKLTSTTWIISGSGLT